MRLSTVVLICLIVTIHALMAVGRTSAAPSAVRVVEKTDGHQLTVDGKPYYVKGAGGDADKALLAASGGNSFRTWGVDDETQAKLDDAQANGLKVALGIWLGHARHGFNYDDATAVQKQFDDAKAAVEKFKDHPAVLLWGVGNEMEGYAETTDPKMWQAVNDIAAMIHELDPNHPTMTVIAEIGGDKLPSIDKYCPAVDIVGINSYGGITSIPERYREAGLAKPYIVTEFGPPGTWEVGRNDWDVPEELSSTAKADIYKDAYDALADDPSCLGSYAFAWGSKQEATATWFGMFLPDGTKTAAVDAMTRAWSGKPPANLCPAIDSLTIVGNPIVEKGAQVRARLKVEDPEGESLDVKWVLYREMDAFETGVDFRETPPTYPAAIVEADSASATLKMPDQPGNYRLFAYVHDGAGGGAVANKPLRVEGETDPNRGAHVNLPLVLHGDDASGMPYIASGYMGNHGAIKMNDKATTNPHSGATCIEATYANPSSWAGVVWQHPPNDWGDLPGGYDLSKAKTLSFWARGDAGGETVKFGYGLLGRDKTHYDSAKDEIEVKLTKEWKQYQLPLDNKKLSRIKSGFYWTLAGQGKPVTFYLDDVRYE